MNDVKTIEKKPAPVKAMLSKNFSLDELCVTKSGLPNVPNDKEIANLRALAENVLQPIRESKGKIVVNSGFRSHDVNEAAGGVAGSQHALGQAADIKSAEGVSNEEIFHFIIDPKNKIPFDQCIAEHLSATDPKAGWVHVSFSATQRRASILSCIKVNGVNKYVPGLVFEA